MGVLYYRKLVEEGSNYEIGRKRGQWAAGIPELLEFMT